MDVVNNLVAYTRIAEIKPKVERIANQIIKIYKDETDSFEALKPRNIKDMSLFRAVPEVIKLVLVPSLWSKEHQFVQTMKFLWTCFAIATVAAVSVMLITHILFKLYINKETQLKPIISTKLLQRLDLSFYLVKIIKIVYNSKLLENFRSKWGNTPQKITFRKKATNNLVSISGDINNTATTSNDAMLVPSDTSAKTASPSINNTDSLTYRREAFLSRFIKNSVGIYEFNASYIIQNRFKEDEWNGLSFNSENCMDLGIQENAENVSFHNGSNISQISTSLEGQLQGKSEMTSSSKVTVDHPQQKRLFKKKYMRKFKKPIFSYRTVLGQEDKKFTSFNSLAIRQLLSFLCYLVMYIFLVKFFWLSGLNFKLDFTVNSALKNSQETFALCLCFFIALRPFYKNTYKSQKVLAFNIVLFLFNVFKKVPCIPFSNISTFLDMASWIKTKYVFCSTIICVLVCPYMFEHNLIGFKTTHLNDCGMVSNNFKKNLFKYLAKLNVPANNVIISESDSEILKSFTYQGSRYIVVPRKFFKKNLYVLQYNIIAKVVHNNLKHYNVPMILDILQTFFFLYFYHIFLSKYNVPEVLALQLVSFIILLCFSQIRNRILFELAKERHQVINSNFPELIEKIKSRNIRSCLKSEKFFESIIVENLADKEYSFFSALMLIPRILLKIFRS